MNDQAVEQVIAKEISFHDHWARGLRARDVPVLESFTAPTCPENRFLLKGAGHLEQADFLELGAGMGEASVFFARQGARVVATDISPEMLNLIQRVAQLHQVGLRTVQMDAANIQYPDQNFDLVYGANVLHHVETRRCLEEVHRVLRPGGKALFWDPIAYNPFINAYRSMADQVRSDDEHPLTLHDLADMRSLFEQVDVQFSWFTSLSVFLKFYFVDQIHPNEERYWKKAIYDHHAFAKLYRWTSALDSWLLKVPGVRWLAWNMAVVLTKA